MHKRKGFYISEQGKHRLQPSAEAAQQAGAAMLHSSRPNIQQGRQQGRLHCSWYQALGTLGTEIEAPRQEQANTTDLAGSGLKTKARIRGQLNLPSCTCRGLDEAFISCPRLCALSCTHRAGESGTMLGRRCLTFWAAVSCTCRRSRAAMTR